jgi:hypothetical protein
MSLIILASTHNSPSPTSPGWPPNLSPTAATPGIATIGVLRLAAYVPWTVLQLVTFFM